MTESEGEGDWESLLDSGQLEANIKKLTILPRPNPENQRMEVICSEEIQGRTQFKPSEPVIKIMKRPDKGVNKGGGPALQSKPRTEQKSLKQREQEYAEARQRILGAGDESLAEKTPSTCTVQPVSRPVVVNKNKTQDGVNTARHPKGPDGSKGFHSVKR